MASFVLWQSAVPAKNLRKPWSRIEFQNFAQLCQNSLLQLTFGVAEQLGYARAGNKAAQQRRSFRRAMRKLAVHECAGQHLAAFACRNKEAVSGRKFGAIVSKHYGRR